MTEGSEKVDWLGLRIVVQISGDIGRCELLELVRSVMRTSRFVWPVLDECVV